MSRAGAYREVERESQACFVLPAQSLTHGSIIQILRPWPEPKSRVRCSTWLNWATQVLQKNKVYFIFYIILFYCSKFYLFIFKYNLLSRWLTYTVYSVLLVLGVDSCDSLLTYNTQCSFQQVPFAMPITHFPSAPPTPYQPSVVFCMQESPMVWANISYIKFI